LAHNPEQIEVKDEVQPVAGEARTVQPCNFRSAGRMSNENARALTAIHEVFARQLASALDAYMGGDLKVKLLGFDQLSAKEHVAAIPALSYLAPFSRASGEGAMVVEIGVDLVFPLIDLLLGGALGPARDVRELSEIEEEIMQELATVIARQAEATWGMPADSLTANRRIAPDDLTEYCPPSEKITLVKLEIEVAGLTGGIQLALPTSFANAQVKQSKVDQPGKKSKLRQFPTLSIRERILDCDFDVAADLPGMRVSVRDLVGLQPGCVLKLRAPVRNPGMLTVGGREIFEAVPVRTGAQKAAQVGRRVQMTSWGKE
jgi:flagellar motor switch protein FliM